MTRFGWTFLLLGLSLHAQAQDLGVLQGQGRPITPAAEGRLLRLQRHAAADAPAYRLVHQGGEPVLIMDTDGRFLTPAEAWTEWGGEKPKPAAHKGQRRGSFSVPNSR